MRSKLKYPVWEFFGRKASKKLPMMVIFLLVAALTGCDMLGGTTPEALPTVVLESSAATPLPSQPGGKGVTASGIIVPAQTARLAFALAGKIEEVSVKEGEQVQAGQVLARLGGAEGYQASLSAAELEVLSAQQALEKLSDDLPEELLAALQALKDAREGLRDAQKKIDGFNIPSEPIDVQVARANVALAKKALDQAKKDFEPYANKPESNLTRAALLNKLSQAQKRYDEAVRQLNRITGVLTPEFALQQAQTDLEIAQTRLELATKKYEELKSGPDASAVELIQARLKSAQDQVAAVRASLEDLELKAPFAGTISQLDLHSGEWAIPGQTVLVLTDLGSLQVETTDLSERDVPQVAVGQPVTVMIEALNQEVSGRVVAIAPLAETLGGDVVYRTTIELDEIPPGLRAGMSVEVQFK